MPEEGMKGRCSLMVMNHTETGYADMILRLEREKEMVSRLTELLRQELDLITSQDVQGLEDSMPEKHRVLKEIAENRVGSQKIAGEPDSGEKTRIRTLQQDLICLWKTASGLNDLSKAMVNGRLSEIDRQLQPFYAGIRSGYDRDGKKTGMLYRRLNTGV